MLNCKNMQFGILDVCLW